MFGVLAARYPGHPLAIEAFRWLTRYHASTEARRRTEIQQKLLHQERVVRADAGGEQGNRDRRARHRRSTSHESSRKTMYRFYSPEAILQVAPGVSRPGTEARWRSVRSTRATRRRGSASSPPAARSADTTTRSRSSATTSRTLPVPPRCRPDGRLARLPRRGTVDDRPQPRSRSPPKPIGDMPSTRRSRPLLDGKLDDACWRDCEADAADEIAHRPVTALDE